MACILVVDDDAQIRRMLQKALTRAGYEVQLAEDGAVALEMYQRFPCKLMIIDLLMPKKEGMETIMEFRREHPEVKIIAISGDGRLEGSDGYLKMAAKLGAAATLSKPFTITEMLDTVAAVLSR